MPRIDVDQAGLQEIKPVQIVKQQTLSDNKQKLSEGEIIMVHLHQFRMFRRDIKLYSRSNLGYGLINDLQLIQSHQLKSRCFINDITGKFKFQEVTWTVQSHQDVTADERFYLCVSSIDNYISLNVQTAVGLDQMSIDVFSYFYDIANEAGLLTTEDQSSSVISIFMF